MPEVVQVTIKTKTQDLFRFMLFHAYTKPSGIMTLVFSVVSLVLLPVALFMWKDIFVSIALALIIVLYLVFTPINLYSQSRRQVTSNPVLKKPITYHISEEIFEVQQFTGTARLFWQQVYAIKKTPFDFLFYVNSEQAFVLPIKSIDPDEMELLEKIIKSAKLEVGKSYKEARTAEMERQKEKAAKEILDPLEKQLMEVASKEDSLDPENGLENEVNSAEDAKLEDKE